MIPIEKIKTKGKISKAENYNELYNSIAIMGMINPILINKDYYIIAGFQRYLIAKELNYKEINVIII